MSKISTPPSVSACAAEDRAASGERKKSISEVVNDAASFHHNGVESCIRERDFPALVSRIESALTAARAEQQERERKRAIQIIKDCEALSAREFDAKYGTASRSSATEAMIAVIRGEERDD